MSNDVIMSFLKTIPMFQNLGPIPLARLAEKSASLKFGRGLPVLEEGRNCNNLFIVVSGKLEVFRKIDDKNEVLIQTLNRGDVYGEAYVIDGSPVTSGLRAVENSVVIGIDRLTINTMFKDNAEFAKNYIRQTGARLREAAAREEALLRMLLSSGPGIPEPYSLADAAKKQEPPAPAPAQASPVNTPEEPEEDGENDGVFFRKELACPLCAVRFRTLKPRQKYIIVEKADEDFCLYYKTVNPLFYEINVCPRCGYSFNSSTSTPVKAELRNSLGRMLSGIKKAAGYCGQRTLEDAVDTFKLAIECHRLTGADDANLGKFFLKLGWLHRYQNLKDQEHLSLEKALYHLSKSYENSSPRDSKEEMNLLFLLGQLHIILGDEKGAVNWFIRITQHPDKKSYPYIVNRARDTWQEIRNKPGRSG